MPKMIITAVYLDLAGSSVAAARGDVVFAGLLFAAMVKPVLSNLKGPAISTVAVNGPATFLGSRHESEQVPPHPYWKL
jgi:hypothetical protein